MTTATSNVEECPPPRPAQGGRAARSAIMHASALACLVREEESPDAIGEYLDRLTLDQLYAAVVTLAATVDPDVDVLGDRLEWVAERGLAIERAVNAARERRRAQARRQARRQDAAA